MKPHVAAGKKKKFLEALTQVDEVRAAAAIAKTDHTNLYKERKRDPEFAKAWEEARAMRTQMKIDMGEEALFRRAVVGWNQPVYHQGEVVGQIRKYSDSDLGRFLEAEKPEKYRKNHKGDSGGDIDWDRLNNDTGWGPYRPEDLPDEEGSASLGSHE